MLVDGSNLYGSLSSMGVLVDDYQQFFRYVMDDARLCLEATRLSRSDDIADEISHIYWYVVASMDDWDLADAKA